MQKRRLEHFTCNAHSKGFFRILLVNSSQRGELVADLFGGSGSTLIACEQRGRKARVLEIDPRYVDLIVRRWQEFTGQKATLRETGLSFAGVKASRADEK